MFTRRFLCVKGLAVTEAFEVAKSKVVCRIEAGEILEAVGDVKKDEAKGIQRVECQITSTGSRGFVTIKGNEGTIYLEAHTPFTAFTSKVDKALRESERRISK